MMINKHDLGVTTNRILNDGREVQLVYCPSFNNDIKEVIKLFIRVLCNPTGS